MSLNEHLTVRERTYQAVLQMILSGELAPGAAIDERALINRLDVSRTPIREAIGVLAKEGLVEIEPYRGFRVRRFTLKEVSDLYELRRALESFAIRLAVEHISNAHIAKLQTILNAGVDALEAGQMQAYGAHDQDFHELIAELSGNIALIDTLGRLSRQIQICRMIANKSPEFPKRAAIERDEILDALMARDADRAAKLMDAHILDVQQTLLQQLSGNLNVANDGAPRKSAPRKKQRD
ncbi:GntR family transcriptional regulator [Mesorhizobium amorphae]|uniref:Putative GntR family transcriptional regulator n=1 Tax=Mesorhizobium amorphae CCNWGS0123 TaxID=1082933 RepID=G6Y5S3_9HYPH|nr:GntR family transcriptional regulator [Mesorhizobium amorphae]EHH12899.1 putative GntR family transcriptional regulator [Mesorhizobium amorphae CCNWGS0123]